MDLDYIAKQVLNGLAAGSIYALVAVGYNMVYGILGLINFAHGDIYMVGTFVVLTLVWQGLPFPLALLLGCLAAGIVALVVERVAYRPVRDAPRVVPMLSAVGVAWIMRNIAQLVWGTETYPFPEMLPARTIMVGDLRLNTLQLIIFALAISLMLILMVLVKMTKLGKATRSVAQDIPAARLMGIPVNRIIQLVYFLGGFLGVIGGVLFSMYYAVWIGMGFLGTMMAWIACIIGGIGSLEGALIGGLLLGLGQALISGFVSSAYRDAIAYGIIMVVLVVKPTGIFGRQMAEKV
jgi:branched-chain amino acid transport system permease protein